MSMTKLFKQSAERDQRIVNAYGDGIYWIT